VRPTDDSCLEYLGILIDLREVEVSKRRASQEMPTFAIAEVRYVRLANVHPHDHFWYTADLHPAAHRQRTGDGAPAPQQLMDFAYVHAFHAGIAPRRRLLGIGRFWHVCRETAAAEALDAIKVNVRDPSRAAAGRSRYSLSLGGPLNIWHRLLRETSPRLADMCT
jgi:hypothetical protein